VEVVYVEVVYVEVVYVEVVYVEVVYVEVVYVEGQVVHVKQQVHSGLYLPASLPSLGSDPLDL